MYELRFSPQAEKYFRKVKEKPLIKAFREALTAISEDPYAGIEKRGDLSGFYCWDVYYARAEYRIAYRIFEKESHFIVIVLAGTRENFYDELKRYIK